MYTKSPIHRKGNNQLPSFSLIDCCDMACNSIDITFYEISRRAIGWLSKTMHASEGDTAGAEELKASRWNHLYGRPAREAVKSGVQLRISSEYCLSELASGQRASYERLLWRQGWRASTTVSK